MEVRISNSITSVAHVVRIWQGSTLVSSHVCKVTSGYTEKVITLPTGTYDFEFINPNLIDCKFRATPIWYNPATNYDAESFPIGGETEVLAGQSYKISGVNSATYTNITLKVNPGQISSPAVLYEVEGTDEITTGNDSDGVAIPSGKGHYRKLRYKKLSDSSYSTMQLENKKNWDTSDGVVDVSNYIPFLALHDATGGGGPTQQAEQPLLSSNYINVGDTITINNYVSAGYTSMLIYKYSPQGNIDVVAGDGHYTLSGGVYTFLQNGNFSFVGVKTGYQNSVIGGLVVSSTLPKPNIEGLVRFVNEASVIRNGASFTGIIVNKDGVLGQEGDVTISYGPSFGVTVTYLVFNVIGSFTVVGTKSGIPNSPVSDAVVVTHNSLLPKPVPSSFIREVGQSVTITNRASFTTVNCFFNGISAVAEVDYTVTDGVSYNLLKVGSYTFFGYKPSFELSVSSDPVIVSAVVLPPDVPTGASRREYTAIVKNAAGVLPENMQFGSSYTNVGAVNNWVDGLVLVIDISNAIRPIFFLRDKLNPTFTSIAFVIAVV